MRRLSRSPFSAVFIGNTAGRLATVLLLVLGLAGCQIQQPSDLLFAPTFSPGPEAVPRPWNTPYDCRHFEGPGWRGITGGTLIDVGGRRTPISQAACFKTEAECKAYLRIMRGYIAVPNHFSCRPINV